MKLKVGDKVRITKHAAWCGLVGEICEVSETGFLDSEFICRIRHKSSWNCLMLENEIEKVSTKGKQLLFEFMM